MKKCEFCGKIGKDVEKRVGDILLCEKCERTRKQAQEENKIVDINPVEQESVPDETPEKKEMPKCELIVGIKQNDEIYFYVGGEEKNLLLIEGLIKYAQKRMDNIWQGNESKPAES